MDIIPQFIKINKYTIQHKATKQHYDCHKNNHNRAICDMFFFHTYSQTNSKQNFIKLPYLRVIEYLVKHKRPDIFPNPFDYFNPKGIQGKGIIRNLIPNTTVSDDKAELIADFFTSDDDINIAIEKSRYLGMNRQQYIENWEKWKEENKTTKNKNNDLFNENQDKDSGLDDIFKILFNVNKADIKNKTADINKLERCLIHNDNVVRLFQCNYVEYERVKKAVEVYIHQGNTEIIRKEIISFVENAPPETVFKINGLLEKGK